MTWIRFFIFSTIFLLSTYPLTCSPTQNYEKQGNGYAQSRKACFRTPYLGFAAIAVAGAIILIAVTHHQKQPDCHSHN